MTINDDGFETIGKYNRWGLLDQKQNKITVTDHYLRLNNYAVDNLLLDDNNIKSTDSNDRVAIILQYNQTKRAIRIFKYDKSYNVPPFMVNLNVKKIYLPKRLKELHIPKGTYMASSEQTNIFVWEGSVNGEEIKREPDKKPHVNKYFIEDIPEVGDTISWIHRNGGSVVIATGRVSSITKKNSLIIKVLSKNLLDLDKTRIIRSLNHVIIREKYNA